MADLTTTRYAQSPQRSKPAEGQVLSVTTPTGGTVRYLRWRLLPQGQDMPAAQNYIVQAGQRLDLIASRVLGDPLQYWRIADANNAMNPFDLVAVPGAALRIPVPQSLLGAASESAGFAPPVQDLIGQNYWDDIGTGSSDGEA